MKQTIGTFLIRRLREVNVRHIFGVPGDYNLEFMQQLEDAGKPVWIGDCNELNASYAADGYARLNGLSALVVTYGVGALSAINGAAGSYCERVPVVYICGSLPLKSLERNEGMHHTLADGGRDNFFRAFCEVTVAQAKLTPRNAASEIDRMITTAWQCKQPVYMELPSDISYLEIDVPDAALLLQMPGSDAERLQAATAAIVKRLSMAKAPALLLDTDAERFDIAEVLANLAEKLQLPVATMPGSKTAFDSTSPLAIGIYQGAASSPSTRAAVEDSDCLLALGYRRIDTTSGYFTAHLPSDTIHLRGFSADVGEENFQGLAIGELLTNILDAMPAAADKKPAASVPASSSLDLMGGPLTQAQYWAQLQKFVRDGDVILAEDGTSFTGASSLSLPAQCTFITQPTWGSIGYTLGSLLGTLMAAPYRRHILLIGDGSFQLTAQALSTMLRHGLKPLIFVINNGGYTIERTILGKSAKYNDVANWQYTRLPDAFCRTSKAQAFVVSTAKELAEVLNAEHNDLVLVEAVMDRDDSPVELIKGGNETADTDYGPRGPQFAPGAQIRIA